MTTFYASPAMRCDCPAKGFPCPQEAAAYAEAACRFSGVAYSLYRVVAGRPALVRRFTPEKEIIHATQDR